MPLTFNSTILEDALECDAPKSQEEFLSGLKVQEKILAGHAEYSVLHEAFPSPIEEDTPTVPVIFIEALEGTQILGAHLSGILDLDHMQSGFAMDDEIHLDLGACLPVMERVVLAGSIS
jgi:hypothetical protein